MDELEREAIAVARQYGFALAIAKPVKRLLVKIADRLEWNALKKELNDGT